MKAVKTNDAKDYTLYDDNGDKFACIFFSNNKFERCWFGFKGDYSRDEWKLLAYIEKQITRIERQLHKKV